MDYSGIYYGMLNPYETSVLSLRPLHRGSVCRLWKSTLVRFLIGNGVQCNHISDKNMLVNMVLEMVEGEPQANVHVVSFNMPPQQSMLGMSYHFSSTPDNTYEQEVPVEPCECHECQHFEAPMPPPYEMIDVLPPCSANTGGSETVFDHSYSDNEDDFVDSNFCPCPVDVDALVAEYDDFPEELRHTITSMVTTPTEQFVEFLQNFGVEVPEGLRCRVSLITLLKDLLDAQRRDLNPVEAPPPPANLGEASGGSSRPAGVADLERMTRDFSRMMASRMPQDKNPSSDNGGEDDQSRECGICLQNPRQIAFVPCGHAICCTGCARKLNTCPVCRKKVHRRLRLYFS